MTLGQTLRRSIALIVVLACAASWMTLGAAFAFDWPRAVKFGAVFAAALSTEGLLWVGAVLLGWTAFANRAQLWKRITGAA